MSPEHQTLKAEGDALARTMAHHRMGQTNPTAHQLMEVAAWERSCAAAGYDGNIEELVERWIYAFSETMRKKMKELLDKLWMGELFTGDEKALGGISGLVLRTESDSLSDLIESEIEISSYPQEIRVEIGARLDRFDLLDRMGLLNVIQPMAQRIGYSMAQLIASKPDRDDSLNRKQRRAQDAEKRGGRP